MLQQRIVNESQSVLLLQQKYFLVLCGHTERPGVVAGSVRAITQQREVLSLVLFTLSCRGDIHASLREEGAARAGIAILALGRYCRWAGDRLEGVMPMIL